MNIFIRGKKLDRRYKEKFLGVDRLKKLLRLLEKQGIKYHVYSGRHIESYDYHDVIAKVVF